MLRISNECKKQNTRGDGTKKKHTRNDWWSTMTTTTFNSMGMGMVMMAVCENKQNSSLLCFTLNDFALIIQPKTLRKFLLASSRRIPKRISFSMSVVPGRETIDEKYAPKIDYFSMELSTSQTKPNGIQSEFFVRSFRSVDWTIDRLLFNCFVFVSLNDFLLIHFERKWKFHSFDCSALFAMAVPMLLLAVLPIPIFKVMLCSFAFWNCMKNAWGNNFAYARLVDVG